MKVRLPDLEHWKAQVKCQAGCPVATDAGRYVQLIAEGRDEDAYLVARAPNPFASVCGRVCAAPCEDACRRGIIDSTMYPPVGSRGCSADKGHNDFLAQPMWEFTEQANTENLIILQIERAVAVEHIDELLSVPGVEAAVLGPNDQALSMGVRAKDELGALLAVGVISMLCFCVVVNIGMTAGMFPIVGIPLPLMSYGGTAVMAMFMGVGLALSVLDHAGVPDAELRRRLVQSLGHRLLPWPPALNARTVGMLEGDGYRVEKIIYQSIPGVQVRRCGTKLSRADHPEHDGECALGEKRREGAGAEKRRHVVGTRAERGDLVDRSPRQRAGKPVVAAPGVCGVRVVVGREVVEVARRVPELPCVVVGPGGETVKP